jgi:hypothetical protein
VAEFHADTRAVRLAKRMGEVAGQCRQGPRFRRATNTRARVVLATATRPRNCAPPCKPWRLCGEAAPLRPLEQETRAESRIARIPKKPFDTAERLPYITVHRRRCRVERPVSHPDFVMNSENSPPSKKEGGVGSAFFVVCSLGTNDASVRIGVCGPHVSSAAWDS